MIWLATRYLERPINLLEQHHTSKVMRERDFPERHALIRNIAHTLAHTARTAHNERYFAHTRKGKRINTRGDAFARKLSSAHVKQDDMRMLGQLLQNRAALLRARTFFPTDLRRIAIGHLVDAHLRVAFKTLQVLVACLLPESLFQLPYGNDLDFHWPTPFP